MSELRTPRLLLRPWRESDRAPLAAMTADPLTMRYFHVTRTRAQSDAWLDRTAAHFATHGYGLWAVEAPGVAELIGFVGLNTIPERVPVHAPVELVWTLGAPFWGHGYAPEAARAALADGFARFDFPEVVGYTTTMNAPSRRGMLKLGMRFDPMASFDHPAIPSGSVLRRHVVYRMARGDCPR